MAGKEQAARGGLATGAEVLRAVADRIPPGETAIVGFSIQRATEREFAYTLATQEDDRAYLGVVTIGLGS